MTSATTISPTRSEAIQSHFPGFEQEVPMETSAEDLETFRRQWREEVQQAHSKEAPNLNRTDTGPNPNRGASPSPDNLFKPLDEIKYVKLERENHTTHDDEESRQSGESGRHQYSGIPQEPQSALEHYERAAERESEGNLGDSLAHYRKAYKLDAGVHRVYKNKHFPAPILPKTSNSEHPVSIPNPAHHPTDVPSTSTLSQLISSFSSLSIPPEKPPTDLSPARPCPISNLPSEILVNILLYTAIADIASFTRLSLVCKSLAYLITNEDRIWRRICLGNESGFESMHYQWALTLSGHSLPKSLSDLDALSDPSDPLPLTAAYPSYKEMLRSRPRIRYNGCYISTVNYIRPGASTASQATWNSPVLIVTYYRYLRFFRNGTCVSLLTTHEPGDVVHYLTKENLHPRHAGGSPAVAMNHALRGRWKLSGNPYDSEPEENTPEGTLHIETEGADADKPNPKYVYRMMLQLKNAGKGSGQTRNNKLSWLSYWSYNKLTDDWAKFGLKNDRAFFWSRVKSYGNGE